MNIDTHLKQLLEKETHIHLAEIRTLYQDLDRKFGLHASSVPVFFSYDEGMLGSYTQAGHHEKEHFCFSLLFIGYAVKNPLQRSDRIDLYKHEYAHYMQYHMEIPAKYHWQPGIHGSAWKYCCSLVGAAPTPYYKVGEGLMKHDYQKALNNPIHDKTIPVRDPYRREREYQNTKNRTIQYKVNDVVRHPKFGEGIIEEIVQLESSVRLHIRFQDELKKIDQKWLLKTSRKK